MFIHTRARARGDAEALVCLSLLNPLALLCTARPPHLDVVVLAQVGGLQVELAEVEPHVETVGHADVPVAARLARVRRWKVGRLEHAVRALRSQRAGDGDVFRRWRPGEGDGAGEEVKEGEEQVTVGGQRAV